MKLPIKGQSPIRLESGDVEAPSVEVIEKSLIFRLELSIASTGGSSHLRVVRRRDCAGSREPALGPGALPPLKALPVLVGREECLGHLAAAVVAFRGIELREPVIETARVRVAPQITEVLHRYEGWIELPA